MPLSSTQMRLWFLHLLEPDSPFYSHGVVVRLSGPLDADALQHSLDEVVLRHESLRTTFSQDDSRPVQLVHAEGGVTLGLHDLRGLSPAEAESEVGRLVAEETRQPFDLETGPLLRAALVRLSEGEHVLLLVTHHLVSDEWSLGVLLRELAALYEARLANRRAVALPELPLQLADYAMWEHELTQGDELAGQLEYWRGALEGAPASLDLPADRPRTHAGAHDPATRLLTLDANIVERLRELGRREGVTLFMTLLAALDLLLYRYTGQEDFVVGTRLAGRTRSETEGLIGPLANMLPLRARLSDDMTFRELLRGVRETTLAAYARQDVPFVKLVEALEPEHDLSRHPIFQVALNVENLRTGALARFGAAEVTSLDISRPPSGLDLEFTFRESGDRLDLLAVYDRATFDDGTLERLLGHYRVILESVSHDPDRRLGDIEVLTEEERERILFEWNRAARDYPRDRLLHELFEEQAARTPEAPAVWTAEDEVLTYAELDERASRLAGRLRGMGVGPETLVGVLLERSADAVVAMLAALKAGGAFLHLDPSLPHERLAYMLEDARPSGVLTHGRLRDLVPESGAVVVLLDSPPDGEGGVALPHGAGAAHPDNAAYVIYTSGSTGRPKGVTVPHVAVVGRLLCAQAELECSAEDSVLHAAPPGSGSALREIFLALRSGARLVVPRADVLHDASRLRRFVAEQGVTVLDLTPTALRELLLVVPGREEGGPRVVVSSGEALPPELTRLFSEQCGGRLHNFYGTAETATHAASRPCEPAHAEAGRVPVGRPAGNTHMYILERHLRPVPIGVAGELYIGGHAAARGYLHRPALTAERFGPDPFSGEPGARLYRTGDLARFRPDGEIELLGRSDRQLKVRGFRVELGEVEAALTRHPSVREAVVVAREAVAGETRLVAYVVGEDEFDEGELRASLAERLPHYMLPSAIVRLDSLPLTREGRVDRRALPAPPEGVEPPAWLPRKD